MQEERSRHPLLSSTTKEWKCAEIVHTKTERLEVDLKRARNQSYAKTMEMSKLLTEKEKLELKIQELLNKNLPTGQRKKRNSAKSMKKSYTGDKGKRVQMSLGSWTKSENESLSCKVKKYAGENAELLRENNDLKEEFYRKRAIMSKLTLENKELRVKTEILTFKNLDLTDEKEELCREYEERLWSEKQLRKDCCTLLMDRD